MYSILILFIYLFVNYRKLNFIHFIIKNIIILASPTIGYTSPMIQPQQQKQQHINPAFFPAFQ